MLRAVLLAIGVVALVGAALVGVLCRALFPVGLWLGVWGIMLVGGILFERGRYKPATPGDPGPGWIATEERFVDPQTGESVTVFYQPSTGERRYVGR
jgi:hypothetical protein